MATYNLDAVAGSIVLEIKKLQLAMRYERHYNVKAQSGLAVGDIVFFNISIPEWVRTICVGKRTDTSNADVITVSCVDTLPIAPVLPIKTASAVQTTGSTSNAASNIILMQLYPVGNIIQVSMQLATSVPAQCVLSIEMYDY